MAQIPLTFYKNKKVLLEFSRLNVQLDMILQFDGNKSSYIISLYDSDINKRFPCALVCYSTFNEAYRCYRSYFDMLTERKSLYKDFAYVLQAFINSKQKL